MIPSLKFITKNCNEIDHTRNCFVNLYGFLIIRYQLLKEPVFSDRNNKFKQIEEYVDKIKVEE